MNIHNLPKTTSNTKKRVGRGHGSGKGAHTVGRGQKGQKSRSTIKEFNFGGAMGASYIKRLPLLRGKGKLKPSLRKPIVVNLTQLSRLPEESTVDVAMLIQHNIVDKDRAQKHGVKILGNGAISTALTVHVPTSASAAEKIKQAGGGVVSANSA